MDKTTVYLSGFHDAHDLPQHISVKATGSGHEMTNVA